MAQFIAAGSWQPPLDGRRAVMPEVPELVEWELLGGLELLIERYAVQTPLDLLASGWAPVARAGDGSVLELEQLPGTYQARRAVEAAQAAARRWSSSPERERARDVWDLGVFGVEDKREVDFTHLHQRWLREAAKGYVLERLATRQTRTAHRDLVWLRHLSELSERAEVILARASVALRAPRSPRARTGARRKQQRRVNEYESPGAAETTRNHKRQGTDGVDFERAPG